MALEVGVGPARLAINQGYGVLITDTDGQIRWPTDKGFYHSDTRVISSWLIFADGAPWKLLNSGNIAYYANRIFLTNPPIHTQIGDVAEHTLGLSISRSIDGGIHEDLDLVNHGMSKVQFNLEIAVRSDFADIFEVKSGRVVRRGRITTAWSQSAARLTIAYINKDFERRVTVTAHKCDSKPVYANGRISFELALKPGEAWHSCLLYAVGDEKTIDHAPDPCIAQTGGAGAQRKLTQWRDAALKIETSNEEFYRFYHQSQEDMAALRLPIEGTDHLEFVPAAGVPWFLALFGRDSLIVSLQNAMVHSSFARGALEVLSRHQAKKRDDYRDAEPGKIMHELRRGELAHFKLIPHTPYYGTADATILYLIVLHNAWRCTGDPELLARYMPVAEKCLSWIEKYGDRDGDGFQEYQTRPKAGAYNQGWKDSGQALVNTDGSIVKTPIALVEIQGYVYDAWLRTPVVYASLFGDLLIVVAKTAAAAWTGGSAMTSEAIHSLVDAGNAVLLLYGIRRSGRRATVEHPLGYGRELYFWSFIVALLLFALGAAVAVYEGIGHIRRPEPIHDPTVNYVALLLAFIIDGWAWLVSVRQFRSAKGELGFYEAFRRSKDPPSFMLLFENSTALLGIVVAGLGTFAATALRLPVLDGIASIVIGLILGATTVLLARESKTLLIGEQADPHLSRSILAIATAEPAVSRAPGC